MKPYFVYCLFIFISLLSIIDGHAQNTPKKAPEFTLQDVEGNKVSLSDLKGKVVYIDFWATWCGPCVAEIPHSKKLSQKFEGKTDLVFLSVSFDQDVERWKKMVEAKKMTGIHLISIKGEESNVLRNYEVTTIPRFVIIDKQGFIREYDAKRPSEQGLEEDLTKILSE